MEKSITFQLWQIPEERQFLSFPSYGEVAPDPAYRMTPVDTYMLSYIVSGKGAVLSEDGIVSVGAGDFCCIRRDAEVICRADFDDPYAVRWFFCRGRLLDSLCDLYDMPPVFVTPYDAGGIFSEWEHLLHVPCPHRREMEAVCRELTASVSALFAAIRLSAVLDLPPMPEDVSFAIRDYLDEHLAADVSLAALSDRFGYTDMHIIRLFRNEFGIPPMQYLKKKRMELAMRLLRETTLPLSVIAERCGYHDTGHFSTAFTKYTGQSPRMYKAANSIADKP